MEDDFILIKGNGPILITAPHNIKTYRYCNSPGHANDSNNHKPGEFRVLEHARENHIEQILNRLYKKLGKKNCTIMTWNKDKVKWVVPMDPNHTSNNMSNSLWFKHLKKLKKRLSKCVLHIDMHGMRNISTENHIELGIKAFKKANLKLYKKIKPKIKKEFDKLGVKYTLYGKFTGSGYDKPHSTVTDKGNILGFKSIQIEIQSNVRKKLVTNNKFLNKFALILKNIYKELKPICNIKTKKVKRKKRTRRNKTRRKR